jgi:hypothetical protein
MSPVLKAVGVGALAWIGSGLSALFALGLVAAATSSLGAGAVGPYLLALIAVEAVFFVAGWVLYVRYLGRTLSGLARVGFAVAHAALQVGSFVTIAFSSLVAFNR